MRFLVKITTPLEPFNSLVRSGGAEKLMQEILGDIKPEAVYFTAEGGHRTAYLVVNLESTSQMPQIAEPWFLKFNAKVEFNPTMLPEDLGKSGVAALGKKWG
jgi:hypothetical protein